MDQIKIGKFIATCRKKQNLTQLELAQKLKVTDRAISRWETGKGMPDASIMLDLCNALNIRVNDLLSGEIVEKQSYDKKAEENLLALREMEESKNRMLILFESIFCITLALFFVFVVETIDYVILDVTARLGIKIVALVLFILGISFSLQIETVAGYYECSKCHHKYTPKYKEIFWSIHAFGNRYLQCPKCKKWSWNKKILSK